MLGALSNEQKKLPSWRKLILQDLLSSLLMDGQAAFERVWQLTSIIMDLFNKVHMVELDSQTAVALTEGQIICRALQTLLSSDLDTDGQVGWLLLSEKLCPKCEPEPLRQTCRSCAQLVQRRMCHCCRLLGLPCSGMDGVRTLIHQEKEQGNVVFFPCLVFIHHKHFCSQNEDL